MIPNGYKQTEIGVIPEDWDILPLKDITEGRFTYGVNAPAIPYAPPLPNYIRITDISDDGYFIKENRTSVYCPKSETYTLKENDIVFARTGASTGKTYLYRKSDGDLVYAGFLIKASILPEKANSKYVFDNLHTSRYRDWVTVTSMRSGQPGINGNEFASYIIPCPALSEQNRIAEALSDVDSMISSLEKLIAKKKAVKQGAMQELLTGKKRLPGFTGEWETKTVASIAEVGRGRVISHIEISKNIGGKYPVYSSQTTNNGIMGYLRTFDFDGDYITWTTDGVNAGTVFCRSGKFNCTNVCGTLKLKQDNPYFVAKRLSLETPNYVATNLANPKLMNDVMKKITITLPPSIEEQTAIASILSDMDNEIEALEQKLEKTRQIKQGMMQQLLTGKIRLV